jgi:hypothetical protein
MFASFYNTHHLSHINTWKLGFVRTNERAELEWTVREYRSDQRRCATKTYLANAEFHDCSLLHPRTEQAPL